MYKIWMLSLFYCFALYSCETEDIDEVIAAINSQPSTDTPNPDEQSDIENLPNEESFISKHVNSMYEEALRLLEGEANLNSRKVAFELLDEAAKLGHADARDWIALGTLLGWGSYHSIPRAHVEFSKMAAAGNPRGQFGLGFMHANGLFVNMSTPHALVYLTFSALGGDDLAEMSLAYRHWAGIGVEESCESALTYYYRVAKKVANQLSDRLEHSGSMMFSPLVQRVRLADEADANVGLWNVLFGWSGIWPNTGDVDQSTGLTIDEDLFQYYQFMADKRNTSAQLGLAQLYYHGRHGVEKNYAKAHYYFLMAAEAGSSMAKVYLGAMLMNGNDEVPADWEKGIHYLRDAADEDNPVGQAVLAMVYLIGKGDVAKDPHKAVTLLLKSAESGWADAQVILGRIFMGMWDGVKADYKLALKYFTMASHQGNALAFFHLGEMHSSGIGVLRSCSTAAELFKNVAERGLWSRWFMYAHNAYRAHRFNEALLTYQLLAELGYEIAQSNVAFMLEEGKASVINKSESHARALIHFQRSAAQGSIHSRIKLGDYHYYGWGTPINYATAVQHYRIASDMNHDSQAMFNLAYMHEQGLGLNRDIHLAKRFYDQSGEYSQDAKIPVQLALFKLSFAFGYEYMTQWSPMKLFTFMFGGSKAPAPKTPSPPTSMDWDYYAIPILAGLLLIFILHLWRERRRT